MRFTIAWVLCYLDNKLLKCLFINLKKTIKDPKRMVAT